MIRPHLKIKPYRSKEYLAFVRRHPCIKCSHTPSESAHQAFGYGGMGTKGPDIWAVPLCNDCHNNGEHQYGEKTFLGDLDLKLICLRLINEFLQEDNKTGNNNELVSYDEMIDEIKKHHPRIIVAAQNNCVPPQTLGGIPKYREEAMQLLVQIEALETQLKLKSID